MFLALRELKYYKTKYVLVTGILVLLTFMVLFLGGLANGLSDATASTIRNSDATHFVVSKDSDEIITRSELSPQQYDNIKLLIAEPSDSTVEHQREMTAFNLQRTAISKQNDDTKIDCTYLAVDPLSFMMVDYASTITLGKNEIVLNDTFEDEGITIGDFVIDVASGKQLKVIDFTHDESYGHSPIGVMTTQTYQEIRSEITHSDDISYNAFAIKDADLLPVSPASDDMVVLNKSEIIDKIPGHSQEQLTIHMILIVLLVVSAAILGVFFYVITIQKIPQFGTLKAIGTTNKTIAGMIFWQVLIISSVSVIIGDLLTFGMASIMPNKMPFTLDIKEALIISASFIAISIVSSLFTIITVAKVDPIIAIGGIE